MKRLRDAWPVIVIVATIAGAACQIAEIRQYIVDHLAAHAESD